MEDTLVLKYNGTSLTTFIDDDGEPWWLDEEVCDFLGIEDIPAAMDSLDVGRPNSHKIFSHFLGLIERI